MKALEEPDPEFMLMMIANDVVLLEEIVTMFEADVREVVVGGLLGTDPVETTELADTVAMGLGATVATLKRDANCSSLV